MNNLPKSRAVLNARTYSAPYRHADYCPVEGPYRDNGQHITDWVLVVFLIATLAGLYFGVFR